MPSPGHTPIRSTDPARGDERARVIPEAAVVTVARPGLLPYYRPPRPRTRPMARRVNEAAGPESGAPPPAGRPRDAAEGSFGSPIVLELVIGNDDRVRVDAATGANNPWRQIAALRIRSRTGSLYVGTAWFIGPQVLATAGHCVYMHRQGGWPTAIDVIPGKRGASEPYGRITSTRFGSVTGWVLDNDSTYDYGVLFLDDPAMGERLGNFEVEAMSDAALADQVASIAGYPADRDQAEHLYYHERPLSSVTESRLEYDIDTFGGQSGSPIWIQNAQRGAVAVGIHTTGGYTSNSGTRVSEPVIENLIRWNEER